MKSKYRLNFKLRGLPRTLNSLGRHHWAVKCNEANKWRQAVATECMRHKKPDKPLRQASLKLVRYSSGICDADGLVSSFKHVIDGLIDAKIIHDDSWKVIGMPFYDQQKAPRDDGYISVSVEAVCK